MDNTTPGNDTNCSLYSQCVYTIATNVGSYLAAPSLAIVTRLIFPTAYESIMGTPSTFGYYGVYIPAREYVCMQVYNNSDLIVGVAFAGVQAVKKATDLTYNRARFFSSSASTSNNDVPDIENGSLNEESGQKNMEPLSTDTDLQLASLS